MPDLEQTLHELAAGTLYPSTPDLSVRVMAAIGRLSAENLNLTVAEYDPTVHFDHEDKWIGLRTPDGR